VDDVVQQTPENQPLTIIQSQVPTVTIIQVPARVVMFNVTEQELDAIASASPQTELALVGMAFGAFIAFLVVILTVQLSDRVMATFVALTVVSFALALFFGLSTLRVMNRNRGSLNSIRNRRI
jgi:thiol:disulfide interchange protein